MLDGDGQQLGSSQGRPEDPDIPRLVLEAAGIGWWQWDLNTAVLVGDDQCKALLGLAPEAQMTYEQLVAMLHPEDRAGVETEVARAVSCPGEYQSEFRVVRPDGSMRWVQAKGRSIAEGHEKPARLIGVAQDVSQRKQAERQLADLLRQREAEQRHLQAVLDQMFAGVIVAEAPSGRLIFSNARSRQMFGDVYHESRSVDEYVHWQPHRMGGSPFDPSDVPMARALRGETVAGEEMLFPRPEGGWLIVSVNAAPIRDSQGTIVAGVTTILDITERKRGERELQTTLESISDGLLVLDRNWRYTYFSENGAKMIGMRREDLLGGCVWDLFPYAQDTQFYEGYHRAVQTGAPVHFEEYYPEPLNKWLECHCYPSVEGLTVYFRDITDRKRAEEELRWAHGLLEGITRGTDDMIAAEDSEFRYLFFNDAYRREFKRLWGRDLQIGTSMVEAMAAWPQDQRKARDLWGRALGGESFTVAMEFGPTEQEKQVYDLRFNPIHDAHGRQIGAAHILRNVTEEVRTREALRQSEEQLKAFNETLEQRVAERTAEAQWRTNQLQRLAAQMIQVEERERRRLAQILHDHLQQLLVAAKIKLGLARRRTSLEERTTAVIAEALELVDEAITESRSLTKELSPPVLYDGGLAAGLEWLARESQSKCGLPVAVQVTPETEPDDLTIKVFVFQAVRELILNAVKHADASSLKICLSRIDGDRLQVVVEDDGTGFDPEVMNRGEDEGGFGLFSIRERLEVIGGQLDIASLAGQGTQATIIAPCTRSQPAAVPSGAVAEPRRWPPEGSHSPGTRIRVLLADDHPVLRKGLADMLSEHPDISLVGEAGDGREALELTLQMRPDVVLMDITMPRMDGIETTRQIKQAAPEVSVIGLSMHETGEMVAAMSSAGASDYLTKTAPIEELISAILRVCPRRR